VLAFIGAAVTLMLGSIPQQDVFQRVTSAKDEKTAVWGSILGGSFYLLFAFVPIFLVSSAFLIDPAMVEATMAEDAQHVLPTLIMNDTPLFAQIIFFGALLSAIMSTAAGTLLAPSVTFTENILKGYLNKDISDEKFLLTIRATVVVFTVCVTLFALNSESSIYEMVGNAYCVTLVSAFVPLAFGVYWKRATTQGALLAIFAGLSVWIGMDFIAPMINEDFSSIWPGQLAGLLASITGMIVGSLMPQVIAKGHPEAA